MSARQKTRYPGVFKRYGKYEINYTDSNGRRVFEPVPGGLQDAQRARHKILERMNRGELVAPSKRTVSECVDLFLESAQHIRPKTRIIYESAARSQVKPRLGTVKISELSKRRVANMVAQMTEEGLSPWTVRGALTVLSGTCQFAIEEGWLGGNPVLQLSRRQKPQIGKQHMKILQTEEIGALLRGATEPYKGLFRLLIFTGLRISEALALNWEDIDFDSFKINVKESKTEAGVRRVSMVDFLARELAKMPVLPGHYPVFINDRGVRMNQKGVHYAFKAALKRAGLQDMRVHDLRHTFASLSIASGEDVVYVAKQMGHANPGITLKVYAQLFDGDAREVEARERMNSRFEGVGA